MHKNVEKTRNLISVSNSRFLKIWRWNMPISPGVAPSEPPSVALDRLWLYHFQIFLKNQKKFSDFQKMTNFDGSVWDLENRTSDKGFFQLCRGSGKIRTFLVFQNFWEKFFGFSLGVGTWRVLGNLRFPNLSGIGTSFDPFFALRAKKGSFRWLRGRF